MTWATIAALLAQYTFPFVDKIITAWMTNPNSQPSADEWNILKGLASNSARTMMLAALSRAGIDPNSDQGKALLAQVPV